MEKKLVLGVLGLLIVGLVLSVGVASAFEGQGNLDPEKAELKGQRQEKRAEQQALMEPVREAIDAGDYDAYLEAIAGLEVTPKMAEAIENQDDFNKLVEIHEHKESIGELSEELGLPGPGQGKGPGIGFAKGLRMGHKLGQSDCPLMD